MKHWSDSFQDQLRETHHPGQIDLFQELNIQPPFRPNVRCKSCGKAWNGEDARDKSMKAYERGSWYVSHSLVRCPPCHREKINARTNQE